MGVILTITPILPFWELVESGSYPSLKWKISFVHCSQMLTDVTLESINRDPENIYMVCLPLFEF